MTFKRMMVLGAVASALVFTGCQDRRHDSEATGGAREQTTPATGGSGNRDSTIPGASDTIGGTRQDSRPGTELGGTGSTGGAVNDTGGTGGAGSVNDQGSSGSLDQGGTGGSGALNDQRSTDSIDGTGPVNDQSDVDDSKSTTDK